MDHQANIEGAEYLVDQATSYMQHISQPFEISQPVSNNTIIKKKKTRTMFSNCQLTLLETTFRQAPYPDAYTRKELANQLGLDETRVQVWFQNRRAKWRKKKASAPETNMSMIDMM